MAKPSTSSGVVNPKKHEYYTDNIGIETTKLLQRLIWKIKQEEKSLDSTSVSDVVSRAVRYTGIHENVIMKMLVNGNPPTIEHKELAIDRRIIQDNLISKYLKENRMPTVTEVFNAVEYLLPCYADIDTFKRILVKMGYVFYKYDKQNTYFVMEKKTVAFQRYKYLNTIQRYRKDKTPIYYIGILSVSNAEEILNLEKTLQRDPANIFEYIFFTVNEDTVGHIKIVASVSFEVFKMWLISHVLPDLPLQSVCVLEDSKIYRKTFIDAPTLNSVKADMVEWLEYHKIPCDVNMSKSELLKLIETFTNTNENTYAIDKIVETYGHKLIRLPECINGLSIAAQVLNFLNKKIIMTGTTNSVLRHIPIARLNFFSDCVRKEEVRLLKEDMQVDNIIDQVVANTRKNIVNENDLLFNLNDSY